MKLANLVITCLLGVGLLSSSGFFNYILCLHPGQDCCAAHVEERDLADISYGKLHVDLLQDEFTQAKAWKGKAAPVLKVWGLTRCVYTFSLEYRPVTSQPDNSVAILRTVRLII